MSLPNSFAFTLESNGGRLNVLLTDCFVCAAFNPRTQPAAQHPPFRQFKAIWDTGATGSVITQRVVDACTLKPTGMTRMQHAHGSADVERFVVNFRLPNNLAIPNVGVIRSDLGAPADILIGMDIIALGDFSISNVNNRTVFSFRIPSIKAMDFVKEADQAVGSSKHHSFGDPPKAWWRKRK